jgi:hypothetical protein
VSEEVKSEEETDEVVSEVVQNVVESEVVVAEEPVKPKRGRKKKTA